MATLKEVAEKANVSQATVSRVLNQDQSLSVSDEVRENIISIANQLGYVTPKMRHALNKPVVRLGIADWHIVKPGSEDLMVETLSTMPVNRADVELSFCRIQFGIKQPVDGIIAVGLMNDEEMLFLRSLSENILFINSEMGGYEYDQILMDYEQGHKNIIDFLLDTKEYRSIGYVGGILEQDGVRIGYKRLECLIRNLKQREIYEEKYFKVGDINPESGYEFTKEMIAAGDVPEVLILGNDEMAERAIDAIKEAHLRIPKDVAIVVYKDIATVKTKYPSFTSLEMLPDIVWTTAVRLLLEKIVDKREESMKLYLPPKLSHGDSI